MKKLIFFDIDGTIVTQDRKNRVIPESFYFTRRALQKNGHLCFVNTGRSFAEIDKKILDLNFDGYVCGCGTTIVFQEKTLYRKTLPDTLQHNLLTDLCSCRLEWLLEGEKYVYYSVNPYTSRIGEFKEEHKKVIADALRLVTPESKEKLDFNKFCLSVTKGSDFDRFYSLYGQTLSFIDRKGGFYEVVPSGHSKAGGIKFLEEALNIPHKDTIAVGDSTNDLSMLEYAAFGIAMGGSTEELTKAADFVTKPLLEDGICHAMKHLGLIQAV